MSQMKILKMTAIKRKIKLKIRNNKKLYSLARFINSWNTNTFYKLIFGFYEETYEYSSFLIEHLGEMYPENIVYDISIGVPEDKDKEQRSQVGFFAQFRWILQALNVAEYLNAVPTVNLGINSAYYDSEMDNITKNIFEYYFMPVSRINYLDVNSCKNVIKFRSGHAQFFMKHASSLAASYEIDQMEIEKLAKMYKKYIRLNHNTNEYVTKNISKCLNKKKTLGIHIRGTDFNIGFVNHPYVISAKEYADIVEKIMNLRKYDQIFLATDDVNTLDYFKNRFGSVLVFYNDTARSNDFVSIHNKVSERHLHFYKLGLEVLRDVYTLASCNSLVCGLSQVAFAAQYIKLSKDEKYEILKIVNRGIKC